MAVVYYRYRSEVKTFSVPVPAAAGATVTVGELKRLILASPRYSNRRHGQSVRLYKSMACDDQYDDDAQPVPLHSTVIAWRVPAGPPAELIVMGTPSSPIIPKSVQERRHGSSSSSSSAASPAAATSSPAAAPVLAPAPPPSIPADLHCRICGNVMADAVVASNCCFWSYCDRCVRGRIAETSRCACGAPARADELVRNPAVRKTIATLLAASAATENARTSVGTPPHDASQKKPGAAVSKHRDGNGGSSSPTSKTAATTTMENHEAHRATLHYRHHERKRADVEDRRQEDRGFKSRCGSPRPEGGGASSVVSLL